MVILTATSLARFDNTMSNFPIDLASVDWLYVAEMYALAVFSTLIGTLALMFATALIFWAYYPDGSSTSPG